MNYQKLYSFRFRHVNQKSREVVWGEIAKYISTKSNQPLRVLDPACGSGEFINSCAANDKWAVDIGGSGSELHPDITFIGESFFEATLPKKYFDLIFMSNILEHMESQAMVNKFLQKAFMHLRPGGIVVVLGPNFKYCSKEYFDFADHTVVLTHFSVEEHLIAANFDLISTTARFLPFSFRQSLPSTKITTKWYLKSSWLWRFFGKQFLVIAKRPDDPTD